MKDTFYFSHDYNARSDDKIKRLIRKHGILGYGTYWAIIEDLYNNANALQTDYEGIAFDLRVDIDVVTSVINDFDLFVIDGKEFGSMSVQNRIDARNERSQKARENANKRWSKNATALQKDATALPPQSKSNAIKERKGKDIKENNKLVKIEFETMSDIFFDAQAKKIKRPKERVVKYAIDWYGDNYIMSTERLNLNEVRRHFANHLNKAKIHEILPLGNPRIPINWA